MVRFETTHGGFTVALDAGKAPLTVANFLQYVDEGFYDGLIFHRVIPGFMVQGGGMTPDFKEKQGLAPIKNEAKNGLRNNRGTLAMARTNDIDSASSQFFINLADNDFLNHSPASFGYAVFGEVVDGLDTIDRIAKERTGTRRGHSDVPVGDVMVQSARRIAAQP